MRCSTTRPHRPARPSRPQVIPLGAPAAAGSPACAPGAAHDSSLLLREVMRSSTESIEDVLGRNESIVPPLASERSDSFSKRLSGSFNKAISFQVNKYRTSDRTSGANADATTQGSFNRFRRSSAATESLRRRRASMPPVAPGTQASSDLQRDVRRTSMVLKATDKLHEMQRRRQEAAEQRKNEEKAHQDLVAQFNLRCTSATHGVSYDDDDDSILGGGGTTPAVSRDSSGTLGRSSVRDIS